MKYVVVTGAYGGMGRATARRLTELGYTVFALDKKVGDREENLIPIECDLREEESVKKACEQVRAVTDELYAVVHFAGIYMLDSLVEIAEQDFTKIFDINLFGVYRVNKAFLPLLKEGSRIIITTSELAPLQPLPFTGIYAISKSALDKYAYSLRMEVQLLGIKVSVLRPGAVKTDMLGVSTTALDRFCEDTQIYKCNAARFKKIVDSVESKNIPPERIAEKTAKILGRKRPKFVYSVNRNFLLRLLGILPGRTQTWIIKKILK